MKFQALVFEENDVRYLGYRMNLRAREFALMRALERSGGYLGTEELGTSCGVAAGRIGRAVPASVEKINRRALEIGERILIVHKRGLGYKLTEKP